MTYSTYILYSDNFDRFYYGQTDDLQSRLTKHNLGKVLSTSPYLPWVLYAYLEFSSRSEAMIMEKKLKNLKSRQKISEYINRNGFTIIQ